jgi:hypothetical protein
MSERELKDIAIRLLLDAPRIEQCLKNYGSDNGVIVGEVAHRLMSGNAFNQDLGAWGTVTYWEFDFDFIVSTKRKRHTKIIQFKQWLQKEMDATCIQVQANTIHFKKTWKQWLP